MRWFLGILVILLAALLLESGLLAYAAYVLVGLLLVSRAPVAQLGRAALLCPATSGSPGATTTTRSLMA